MTAMNNNPKRKTQYPGGDCIDWDYQFYVVNGNNKFIFGFDDMEEAISYSKELNEIGKKSRVVPYHKAIEFNNPPYFENNWTESYIKIKGLTH